jgi:hypothetical protein
MRAGALAARERKLARSLAPHLSRRLLGALVALIAGCASNGAAVGPAPPPLTPVEELRAVLEAASSSLWYELRYNPVPCDCPPYELRLGDSWVRVALRPPFEEEQGPTAALLARSSADLADERLAHYAVFGGLDDGVQRCETNALVARLDVASWSDQVPPPLPPAEEEPPKDAP